MKKLFVYILAAVVSLFCAGCQKSEMQVLRSLPSEVKFTNIDLTGAHSLAVMQTKDGKVVTRSYSEPDYRLCIMDAEGKAKIASLTLRTVGNESNSAWKKIKQSLTLVPGAITPISSDYLHLDEVVAVHKENLSEITYGAAEYTAISEFLGKLGGGSVYIDFSETPSVTLRQIPGQFGEFDSNGKAYIPDVDFIESYDAFTGVYTKIPVQWDKTSVGSLVSAERNNTSGDYYVVKGLTREATTVVALIEKSTGLVTITDLTELGSPIVTASYRLN